MRLLRFIAAGVALLGAAPSFAACDDSADQFMDCVRRQKKLGEYKIQHDSETATERWLKKPGGMPDWMADHLDKRPRRYVFADPSNAPVYELRDAAVNARIREDGR